MNWQKMTRLAVPMLLAILSGSVSGTAMGDEYRSADAPAAQLQVREWSTPYTLDIPADLGRGQNGGQIITYAPAYGQNQGARRPRSSTRDGLLPNDYPFALPDQRRYRQR